jgi:uncharacterized Zn-finger protein
MKITLTCPVCGHSWECGYLKWLFSAVFHRINFKEFRDYRKTKCPYCGTKSFIKKSKI